MNFLQGQRYILHDRFLRQDDGETILEELDDFERSRRRLVVHHQSLWGSAVLLLAVVAATILVSINLGLSYNLGRQQSW